MFSVLDPDLEITIDFYDDGEKVYINFPREDDDIEYDIDELLKLKSLVLIDTERGRVCTLCISVKVTPLFRAKLATNLITG